jgi:NADH:ubiquinone oxidoreductase subunit
MATIGTRLFTWLRGEEVGVDDAGNRYYRQKGGGHVHPESLRKERRWVIYAEGDEASKVPAEWHAWLHHTTGEIPPEGGPEKRPWMKPHQPNLTGTDQAYRPPGHTLKGGKRYPSAADYEPWRPE